VKNCRGGQKHFCVRRIHCTGQASLAANPDQTKQPQARACRDRCRARQRKAYLDAVSTLIQGGVNGQHKSS
jgi:hypothetical protein